MGTASSSMSWRRTRERLRTLAAGAALVFASSGCGADHSPICRSAGSSTYRIAYGTLSRDCSSGADVELPAEAYLSADNTTQRAFSDRRLSSDATFERCSAAFSLDLRYTSGPSVGKYVTVISSPKHELDIGGDGTLRGTVEIEVGMTAADSVGHATCTASGPVVLTVEPAPDAGHGR